MRRIFAAFAFIAAPALAQQADAPRGTYFVYGEADGVALVSYEPQLAANNVWPLAFEYFYEGQALGSAQMVGRADCAQGQLSARLTHVNGAALDEEQARSMPAFTFDRAGGGGDAALVNFVCGTADQKLSVAAAPIFATPAKTVADYRALVAAGIDADAARSLAIRDPEQADALIDRLVPAGLRAAARTALALDE